MSQVTINSLFYENTPVVKTKQNKTEENFKVLYPHISQLFASELSINLASLGKEMSDTDAIFNNYNMNRVLFGRTPQNSIQVVI